jgi:glycosyltransferase involved in cell wall biosynthesis
MSVLYITHNGLADHIGQSQVLPYLLGLAARGFRIAVVSAEKPGNDAALEEIAGTLAAAGIEWRHVTYHNKPPLVSTVLDLFRMYRLSRRIVRDSGVRLVHCRSFLPMAIGLMLKRSFGIPLIFDFRDFWADRGLYSQPFKFVYRFFKRREGTMVRSSDHIVTLTHQAKHILHRDYLGDAEPHPDERFTVIPTCADVGLFDTRGISASDRLATRKALGIGERTLVLGYLGTVHSDYMPAEMFRAFRALKSLEPDSAFLFVSHADPEMVQRHAAAGGVDPADVRVVAARRAEVPRYLATFDLSVVFIRADPSTAGVSPTKLAELFACNIPVIASAGVGDMDEIINPGTNDSILVRDYSESALRAALSEALRIVRSPGRRGREASHAFSLSEGVNRYHSVYSRFVRPVRR